MKILSLLLPLFSSAPFIPDPAPFAIHCAGTATAADEKGAVGSADEVSRIYVIDPRENTVKEYLEPRQEFSDVCSTTNRIGITSITPGLILSSWSARPGDKELGSCEIKINRISGALTYVDIVDYGDGGFWKDNWVMQCKAADIPVIDVSKRKF